MVAQEFKMRSEKKKSFLLRQVALLVFMLSEHGICDLKLDCTYLQLHSWSYLWAVYALNLTPHLLIKILLKETPKQSKVKLAVQ